MKKKEKMKYSCRRKTLKGRLQKSLTVSSFLSIAILLVSMMILLLSIIRPIGHFFTDTVSNRIHRNYIMYSEAANKFGHYKNKNENLYNKSFDEILEIVNDRIVVTEENIEDQLLEVRDQMSSDDETIIIEGNELTGELISETEKKQLLISTKLALDDVHEILPIGNSFGLDFVNVVFELNGEEIYKIPEDYDTNTNNIAQRKIGDVFSSINVVDSEDQVVGTIKTSLNTGLLSLIIVPIGLLFILVAIMTFIIVKIILLPFTYRLLKPITALNNNLKRIAEDDHIECSPIKIEQKKPPTEVKMLIDYSNTIINKLQQSYHQLESHKDELEAQNEELDAQKDELEAQKDELEAQKDELEAQNHELTQAHEKIRSTQAQLVQSEKMASMGQLTAAIMHEINTPLGAIQSNNQINQMMLTKLLKCIEENDHEGAIKIIEKMKKSSGITVDAANRMSEIIRNLKNFSRVDQAEFQNADIVDGLKSVLVLTSNLWKNKVTIDEKYDQVPLISCYPSMINQVFMNVLVNAIQASDKGGHIDIDVNADTEYVYISFKDEGSGIQVHDLEHIFDNGFTTKPKDEGTGLGLSISKDIVDKHHGEIKAFNNEDKGAMFVITLPIRQKG